MNNDRAEYVAAIHDLLMAAERVLATFPRDGVANGYPESFGESMDEIVWQIADWYSEERDAE